MELLPTFVKDLNTLEKSCCIACMGVPLYPQAIRRQVKALPTVSHCFHALLLPSAYLRMVLAYTLTYVHACRHSYTFRVACPGHALFSMCRVTCFVVPYQQSYRHVYPYAVVSVTWLLLCFEQPLDFVSTYCFSVSIVSAEKT